MDARDGYIFVNDRQTSAQTARDNHKSLVSRRACWGLVMVVDWLRGVMGGGRYCGRAGKSLPGMRACCAVFKHYGRGLTGSAAVSFNTVSVARGWTDMNGFLQHDLMLKDARLL